MADQQNTQQPAATPPVAPPAPQQPSEGEDWVMRAIRAVSPKGQEDVWAKRYMANRNAWNLGIGAAAGLGTAALAHGVGNAFSSDDRRGGGGSSPWGWLMPMAIGAGGMWLWGKYGDQIKKGFSTLSRFNDAAARIAEGGLEFEGPGGLRFKAKIPAAPQQKSVTPQRKTPAEPIANPYNTHKITRVQSRDRLRGSLQRMKLPTPGLRPFIREVKQGRNNG